VGDVTCVVLDRPRHEGLIAELRLAGARIKVGPGRHFPATSSTHILCHRFLSYMASYNEASNICQAYRPPPTSSTTSILDPRFLSQAAFYDMASNV
jgi:hypothetical protein